jgi:hypothetical protein
MRHEADIGDPVSEIVDLYTLFREDIHAPLFLKIAKAPDEKALQARVRCFAHISLQNLAVDVIAIGAVGGVQVLFDWDENRG